MQGLNTELGEREERTVWREMHYSIFMCWGSNSALGYELDNTENTEKGDDRPEKHSQFA